jgi:hypothetical protein
MGLVGLLMALMLRAVLWLRGTPGPTPTGKEPTGAEEPFPVPPTAAGSRPSNPITGPIQRAREAVVQGEAANERLEKAIEELR